MPYAQLSLAHKILPNVDCKVLPLAVFGKNLHILLILPSAAQDIYNIFKLKAMRVSVSRDHPDVSLPTETVCCTSSKMQRIIFFDRIFPCSRWNERAGSVTKQNQ